MTLQTTFDFAHADNFCWVKKVTPAYPMASLLSGLRGCQHRKLSGVERHLEVFGRRKQLDQYWMWLELGYFFQVLPNPPDFVEGRAGFSTPDFLEAVELVGLANGILAYFRQVWPLTQFFSVFFFVKIH